MPRFEKQTLREMINKIKHNNRTSPNKKEHIYPECETPNRRLSPDRQYDEYKFYKERIKNIDVGRMRKNRVVCVEWVISAPDTLNPSDVNRFFDVCYDYLVEKYGGEQNVISCYQHMDEDGEPHIHFQFLPLVKNADGSDRLNAKELLDNWKTKHLTNWHNELDAVLKGEGLPPTQNGAVKKFGRNRTVSELKRTSPRKRSDRERRQDEKKSKRVFTDRNENNNRKLKLNIRREPERGVLYEDR